MCRILFGFGCKGKPICGLLKDCPGFVASVARLLSRARLIYLIRGHGRDLKHIKRIQLEGPLYIIKPAFFARDVEDKHGFDALRQVKQGDLPLSAQRFEHVNAGVELGHL